MSTPGHNPQSALDNIGDFFARLGKQLDDFWQRVTEGIEVQALWSQFVADARVSYSLYSREVDWDALQRESRGKRIFKTASALFWAMMMKLSPARRVFLLIALILAILGIPLQQIQFGKPGVEPPPSGFNMFHVLSVAALLLLLALELADRVTMKRDLEIAREIQHWLVPEVPPQVPGVDIAFTSRPANTVGGDYYDAFLREAPDSGVLSKRLLLVVADVAGKSVPASLLMATFQASLRTLAAAPVPLLELVEGLNHYACAHSLGGRRFTTAFFAELEPATRALNYIRAGHNAPVLRRASGSFERLETGDLPLGIDTGVRYACGSTTLASGDLLVVFTDGVIEAVNELEEEFGEQRLLDVLRVARGMSAESSLKTLMAAVDTFAGRARQHDDVTCLILRAV